MTQIICQHCGKPALTIEPPTAAEYDVLNAIDLLTYILKRPPRYREVAKNLGLTSLATVHEHVVNMRRKGLIVDAKRGSKYALVTTRWAEKHAGGSHEGGALLSSLRQVGVSDLLDGRPGSTEGAVEG